MTTRVDLRLLYRCNSSAFAKFRYKKDVEGDEWHSSADQVLAGESWEDDCDGMAQTVLDLLIRAGVPKHQCFRLKVSMNKNYKIDHMIGCVRLDDGTFWIVGDTGHLSDIYPAGMFYLCMQYNQVGELTENGLPLWREGAPWQP